MAVQDPDADIARIKELMTTEYSPRHINIGNNSKMTFTFKNNFGIDRTNWEETMRMKLEEWRSLGLVVSTGAPQTRFGPIPDETHETDATVGSQLPTNEDLTGGRVIEFNALSEEQKNFVTRIEANVMLLSESSEPITKCFFLEGLAGTGKMNTLGYLRYIDNCNILYVAKANSLCNEVNSKFNMQTSTFYNFITSGLYMSPESKKNLINDINYVSPRPMLEHHFSSFNSWIFSKFLKSKENLTDFSPWVNIIFLDEFSMFAPGSLACFVALVKTASTDLSEKFIIIFCGDFMHIPPVFTESMDYSPLKDICADTFTFTTQHRVVHEDYLRTVNNVCMALLSQKEIRAEFEKVIPPNTFVPEVNYVYPFEDINEAYTKLQNSDLYTWLNNVQPEFFSRILALNAFTYKNRERHYCNLSLAFSIVSQLMQRNISIANISEYICFTDFTAREPGSQLPLTSKDFYGRMPYLPFMRFFPYRLLMTGCSTDFMVSNKCVVYLIHWNLKKGYVIVYCPEIQKFLTIPCGSFKLNSSSAEFLGIPLEMAFATTFHMVQGQTLTQDVIIALNGIDRREMFAILTRIRNPSQIKNIWMDPTEEENA